MHKLTDNLVESAGPMNSGFHQQIGYQKDQELSASLASLPLEECHLIFCYSVVT
jgi:hypothetical protein